LLQIPKVQKTSFCKTKWWLLTGWPDWPNVRIMGDCLLLVFFYYRSSPNVWATNFLSKCCVLFSTKKGLGYILGDFSQAHPVTLIADHDCSVWKTRVARFFLL
jgi:hypothetical protein